jgi:hypothetical protein
MNIYLHGQPVQGIRSIAYPDGHGKAGTLMPGMRYRDLVRLHSSNVMSSAEYERYTQPLRIYTTLSDGFGRPITWAMVQHAADSVNPLLQPGKSLPDEACRRMLLPLRQQNRDTLAPPTDGTGRPLAPNGILTH